MCTTCIISGSSKTGETQTFELRMRGRDGAPIWVRLTEAAGRNEQDEPGFRGALSDIGDQKRAEAEQRRLQDQLQQSQKMESVGRLAGGVAHDFNNMLLIILGYTEIALQRVGPEEALHTDLLEIQKAAQRSADLTKQLLAFARRQTVVPKVLDLGATVEGTLKMLRRLIGEDIELVWRPPAGLWPVLMDPSQIDQILTNLCVNAKDAISVAGRITIEAENCELDASRYGEPCGFKPGSYVRLSVGDTGCGIGRDIQSLIFEPFFTTKRAGEGTGLGLSTVHGIVQQNHGFVEVESERGEGTQIHVYLPRHDGGAAAAPSSAELPLPRGQETILLVDDEAAILKVAKSWLGGQGYTVLSATTPREAIQLARQRGEEISMLITDVVMPEMNGHDLAQELLAINPHMKCLFMSGYTADIIADHGVLEAGLNFLQKPFTLRSLAEKTRQALDRDPAGGEK
jgi:two-component system, cell cycle sensor histidine kinase and response regulator CckA